MQDDHSLWFLRCIGYQLRVIDTVLSDPHFLFFSNKADELIYNKGVYSKRR